MGMTMARDIVLCALVLLQLLCAAQSHSNRRMLELPLNRRGLSPAPASAPASKSNVLRGSLIHRDYLESTTAGTNTASIPPRERFFENMERSRRRAVQLTSYDSPLSAYPIRGEYVMQIAFGTPPQQFTVEADTGSDLTWLHCTACGNGGSCNVFDPSASSTFSPSSCSDPLCQSLPTSIEGCTTDGTTCLFIDYAYGDRSNTTGELAYDVVTLSDSTGPTIAFGCGTDVEGFDNVDGLLALGTAPLSLPNQLAAFGVENIFSYCLVDQAAANQGNASQITFGAAAENSGAFYTPMLTDATGNLLVHYYVQVIGITVGGAAVPIDASVFQIDPTTYNGGVILDSGTTYSQWAPSAYTAITTAFQQSVSYTVSTASATQLCFDTTGVDPSTVTFPDFGVQMTNVTITTPGSTVFELMNDGVTYCLAMASTGDLGLSVNIIGNVQQRDFLVVYDLVNQQIGFQGVNCGTLT